MPQATQRGLGKIPLRASVLLDIGVLLFFSRGLLTKQKKARRGFPLASLLGFRLKLAPQAGLEPATKRLTAACSTN